MEEKIGGDIMILKDGREISYKWTGKLIHCKDGGYAGSMNEVPIVAQGDTKKELISELEDILREVAKAESKGTKEKTLFTQTVKN